MPHENINSSIDGEWRTQVIWKPAAQQVSAYDEPEPGYVQLMTEHLRSSAIFPGSPPSVVNEAYTAGATPGQPHPSTSEAPAHPCTGFAVMHTREDINRVIRMLRRARDSAFGADA
jgi:hypothetical protein